MSDRLLLFGAKWDWCGPAFFILVPLALAAITATKTGYNRAFGYGGALLSLRLLSLIPWWIGEGGTRIVWAFLRRYRPPLWLVCALGVLVACVVVGPYVAVVSHLFKSYWSAGDPAAFSGGETGDQWTEGVTQVLRAIVFWTAANYIFDRFLDYPRFRNADLPDANKQSTPPISRAEARERCGLLRRLDRIEALSEINLLKAEEHYVRVRTEHDEEFIAYRFGKAVREIAGEDGFQVHRSYWVRRTAVAGLRETGSRIMLELADGSTVPVSRPYHALVRQVAWPR
ncbi:MAG: LytTR family DNA-binding domain-containing protein [Pseudomonadota bacterium]